jgi:hypothetical protein
MAVETPRRLLIEPMDIGPEVRAIALTLVDAETDEPVTAGAGAVWARVLRALARPEPLVLDFFSHVDRVREYCRAHGVAFLETCAHGLTVIEEEPERVAGLLERFRVETFGARAGSAAAEPDPELETELRRRGLDAYQPACARYSFCALCELDTGSLTLVSHRLWASEVARRVRPALSELSVAVETIV